MHSSYETRKFHDLQIPRLNTEHAKTCFNYSTLQIWNDTPVDIEQVSTLGCFKKTVESTPTG